MATALRTEPIVIGEVARPLNAQPRLASIDIFRGLTMVVMIFVNDLSGVSGLPWWNYHMPGDVNGMTYVDMVFPFFLFAVGLSLPFSLKQRLRRNSSQAALWIHVVVRSLSLIVLGYILANHEHADASRMAIDPHAWLIFSLLGAALFLHVYERGGKYAKVHVALRIIGIILLAAMLALFRRTTADGQAAWLEWSYPEILGLIGYTYFSVCLLYIPTRRWRWAAPGWFLALLAFNIACVARLIPFVTKTHLRLFLWPFGNGAFALIAMGGVVTSVMFLGSADRVTLRRRMLAGIGFAAASFVAGWLLTPLGISKIRATPTWCLYSVGAAVLLVLMLYWLCDLKHTTAWAACARPAGANTLLTYLLPYFFYVPLGWIGNTYFEKHLNFGWQGALWSAAFTAIILFMSAVFTRLRVRLQL